MTNWKHPAHVHNSCTYMHQGWIQDFPGGGGGGGGGRPNGVAWRMAVAAGRMPLKLLPCMILAIGQNVCYASH